MAALDLCRALAADGDDDLALRLARNVLEAGGTNRRVRTQDIDGLAGGRRGRLVPNPRGPP